MYKNQVIVIRNRKIIEVGSAPKINDKDKIIDLSNSWVLPGLMDCHVHVTVNLPYRNVKVEQMYSNESTSLRAIRGVTNAVQNSSK